ncbi:MAG: FAD-dependent oxidoreductase, partial [Acidobacteria bacterium]|nr:FAD-dependent oxidoreductase [Acidobacteriota bacterium]
MGRGSHFDLLILGSGSTAFAAALRAAELGKTAAMTEERTVGGTCVNRGCLPSKNLIEAARLLHDAQHPRYPGLTPAKMGLNFRELIAQKDEIVRGYRHQKYESLVGDRIVIERGHARFIDEHTVEVGGKRLTGDTLLIASGSRPSLPPVEGLDSVPYLTSDLLSGDGAAELTECPGSLIVIGGGYIALELGQMFSRFGSRVTILVRNSRLLVHGYEPEVGPAVREIFFGEGISVVTGASVSAVRAEAGFVIVEARVEGGTREFRADKLLVATGRRPNADRIAVENAG